MHYVHMHLPKVHSWIWVLNLLIIKIFIRCTSDWETSWALCCTLSLCSYVKATIIRNSQNRKEETKKKNKNNNRSWCHIVQF